MKLSEREKIDFLNLNYIKMGTKHCSDYLNITPEQTRQLARKLNLSRYSPTHFWNKKEIRWLKENYPLHGAEYCTEHLKLKYKQVVHKLYHLGIWKSNKYTEYENQIIKNFYPKFGAKYCSNLLKNRSIKAVGMQAKELEVKKEIRITKEGFRYCKTCDEEKLLEEFSINNSISSEIKRAYRCKECFCKMTQEARKQDPIIFWAKKTILSHKIKHNVNFTAEQLVESFPSKNCFYCNKQINWNNKTLKDDSPSLDRIDNTEDLFLDNVCLTCAECNSTKSNRNLEEFLDYMDLVRPKILDIIQQRSINKS